tara:strand:- start:1063 stop:2373 length:1311 start_codon:yes stop_codon:yes gene_type:complete
MNLLLFFSYLAQSVSHLTGISTCTDPQEPGNVTFFLATYHSYTGAVAPGTVHIKSPSGDVSTFSLDQSRQANPIWNGPLIMTGSEWDSNIKSTYEYHSNVSCSHFGDKPDDEITYPALGPDDRQSCGFNSVYTYYTAKLVNAVSGTYELWLTGTDAILAYQPVANKNTPCEDSELVVDLIISDGLSGCDSLPTQVEHGEVPPSYCQNVISGYRCPTRCQSGYYATGYNQCNNMVWVGNFQCYETLPCLSSDVNSVLNNIDLSKVVGIVGDGCDFTIANGTKCQLSCVSGYYGTGDVECFNGTVISNNANCSVIVPTPSPTPNPTPEPTPSPTPDPTPSPTPLQTPSPTPLQTLSPTPVPTVDTNSHSSDDDYSNEWWFILSFTLFNVGVVMVFVVIILILCCLFCRKKRNNNTEDNDNVEMVDVNKLEGPEQGDKI